MIIAEIENAIVESLFSALQVSGVLLGVSLVIGLVCAVLQAATQIQEQTLTFVPKLVGVVATMFFLGHWMVALLVNSFSSCLHLVSRLSVMN